MPAKTALIVIDMQELYIGEKSRYSFYPITLIDKVNERITTAKDEGVTIIYVKNKGNRNGEVYISDFAHGLSVVSDIIIEKSKASIFENDTILEILQYYEITEIEVIGIDGNICVASSALDAAKLGFSVIFPLEYIGIKSEQLFVSTKEKLLIANVNIV